ncbi:hypothetical protein MHYP_G00268750 [Metynnis hypsauchen]
MLFIDFSLAFNTIIPQQLVEKLSLLGLNTFLCNWVLDFLTERPQDRIVRGVHLPLNITGFAVEIVRSTKFLGVHITENLTSSLNTNSIAKRAQQHLYFLQRMEESSSPSLPSSPCSTVGLWRAS